MSLSRLRSHLPAAASIVAAGFLIIALGSSAIDLDRARLRGTIRSDEGYYLPSGLLLRALSFGFNELLADMVWLRTIGYFVDHTGSSGDQDLQHLHRYIETILALDSHFQSVYRLGSAMLMSRGAHQRNEDVLRAIALLKRGHRLYPRRDAYPLMVGSYYLSELRTNDPKQRRIWRRQGAEWIHRAILVGAKQPWLASLTANIYTEQGERELAIQQLKELYLVNPDKKARHQIAAKMRALQKGRINDLVRDGERFDQAYQKSPLRFLPADLYVLLDDRE